MRLFNSYSARYSRASRSPARRRARLQDRKMQFSAFTEAAETVSNETVSLTNSLVSVVERHRRSTFRPNPIARRRQTSSHRRRRRARRALIYHERIHRVSTSTALGCAFIARRHDETVTSRCSVECYNGD